MTNLSKIPNEERSEKMYLEEDSKKFISELLEKEIFQIERWGGVKKLQGKQLDLIDKQKLNAFKYWLSNNS